nr:DUF2147 domain-containing protein [Erythrobacter donghaensis]
MPGSTDCDRRAAACESLPESGKSYRSVIRRKGANALEVKGCVGPFCQTQVGKKVV